MIFEPHSLYGERDPDGNAWPFGYISNDTTPNGVPLPIFELGAMFAGRDTLTQTANLMAAASDLLLAVKCLCEEMADYMTINKLGDPNEKHNYRLGMAAIAKAERT